MIEKREAVLAGIQPERTGKEQHGGKRQGE
jgi:hypothetical protein